MQFFLLRAVVCAGVLGANEGNDEKIPTSSVAKPEAVKVEPSCYRDDGIGKLFIHVRVPSTYTDLEKRKQRTAMLLSVTCGRKGRMAEYECKALKLDLDRETLSYMDVNTPSIHVVRHRGPTTILEWGLHTVTVRWDQGVVIVDFDGPSISETVYEPTTCGQPEIVGKPVEKPVWSWGKWH